MDTLKEYKIGNVTEKGLLQLIGEFEHKFSINKVTDKINSYVNQCTNELDGIQFAYSKNNLNDYIMFTDKINLDKWYTPFRTPKILLETDAIRSKKCNFFIL